MINSNESAKVTPTWSGSVHSSGTGPAEVLETRELRSRFSILSAIGIQYSISATPIAVGSYIIFILGAGGSPFFFWAFVVTVFGNMLVCISMAEIASAYPHASGKISPLRYLIGSSGDVNFDQGKCFGRLPSLLPNIHDF